MKSFKLDNSGDVIITDNKIELVDGVELIAQTVKQVLGTNLGEWFGDLDEGIDFHYILTKNPDFALIQDTINTAVQKVADGLNVELETDNFAFDTTDRKLNIYFTLTVDGTESTNVEMTL